MLVELGNTAKAIPYYAVFLPNRSEPIHFDGVFFTPGQMLSKIKLALPSDSQSLTSSDVSPVAASQ